MNVGTAVTKGPRFWFRRTTLLGFLLQLLWLPLAGPILLGLPRLAVAQLVYAGAILLLLLCAGPLRSKVIAQTMNPQYPKIVFIANGALLLLVAYMSVSEIRFVRRFDVPTTWQQASGITFLGGELLLVVCSLLANITAYLIDRRS